MNFLSLIFSNTIIAFIVMISVIVFVHELGHFLAGKLFKIKVEEFSIGFGPKAFSFQKGDTVYRINWLPLGGYVRFYGADLEILKTQKNHAGAFLTAPLYKRAIVSFAGPFSNFVLSFLIMILVIGHGIPTQPTFVSVLPHSIAAQAGLRSGDKITKIDGQAMENWPDVVKKISQSPGKLINITVAREKKSAQFSLRPSNQDSETMYGTKERSGKIGITPFFSAPFIVPFKDDIFLYVRLKATG